MNERTSRNFVKFFFIDQAIVWLSKTKRKIDRWRHEVRKKETVDGETRKREREEREIARKEGCFALSTRANSINELTFSYIIGGNDSFIFFLKMKNIRIDT